MTSLLTTAVDESCQSGGGTLRGRRRSSVHPLSAVPRLFFSQSNSARQVSSDRPDENAVADDIEPTPWLPDTLADSKSAAQAISGPSPQSKEPAKEISPLRHAHVSDYAPKMIVPRHQDSLGSTIDYSLCSTSVSPRTPSPPTGMNSRKGSYDDLLSNMHTLQRYSGAVHERERKEKFERMKWRLAAGYFAFFMCGWGDGSTYFWDSFSDSYH